MSLMRCSSGRRAAAPLMTACLFAVLLASLAIAAPAVAQTAAPASPAAPAHAGGGEASLRMPDVGAIELMGVNGRTLLVARAWGVRAGVPVRTGDFPARPELARPPVDARDLGADLRDLQDIPDHPGEVPPDPRDLHRPHHRALFRRPAPAGAGARPDHPALQPHRNRGELRGGVVRHADQHLRELEDGVREPRGPSPARLLHSARVRNEHRDAADQRRALPDALHPALRARRVRRAVLHRLRDRGIPRRGGAPHRGGHLHQDRRHRLRPHEDRLQHQGGRRAQPRRHRRLHGGQRRGLGRPDRGRLRNLRGDRRRPDLLHPPRREGSDGPGPALGLDLHDAGPDDRGQRRLVPGQRGDRPPPLR